MSQNFINKKRQSPNTLMRIKRFFCEPRTVMLHMLQMYAPHIKNDRLYLQLLWFLNAGKKLNLKKPQTFQEKLQWLKLYNRKSLYTIMVDKHEVKEYVAKTIGDEYLIPSLGVWEKFEDIDFSLLPDKFVLKCTHDSGGLVICRDKATLDWKQAKQKIERCLKRRYFYSNREWPYKDVKPRIIAEEYIEQTGVLDLKDYKFFCFNGRAEYCQVIADRNTDESIDFYDRAWNHQEFIGLLSTAHHAPIAHHAPETYDKMVELADCIAKEVNSPFVRVDFYNVNEKIYFGEITFYPAGGFGSFKPVEWNKRLGDLIVLNSL